MLNITNVPLFAMWLAYCEENLQGVSLYEQRVRFACEQFPIVEEALHFGLGIRACTARAHDLTCVFVEKQLAAAD